MKGTKTERVSGMSFQVADIELDNDTRELAHLQEIREDAGRNRMKPWKRTEARTYVGWARAREQQTLDFCTTSVASNKGFVQSSVKHRDYYRKLCAGYQTLLQEAEVALKADRAELRKRQQEQARARRMIAAYDETLKALGGPETEEGDA